MVIFDDLYRRRGEKSVPSLLKELIVPQFFILFLKRLCEKCRSGINYYLLYPPIRVIYEFFRILYGVDLPASVVLGKGFRIGHIGSIAINPKVIIGENVDIYNGVVIGESFRGKYKGTPKIGNKVWIGPNAVVVGNIKVGNDVLIAPNSLVNRDVPDHSVVSGNPMRIISSSVATDNYIINEVY